MKKRKKNQSPKELAISLFNTHSLPRIENMIRMGMPAAVVDAQMDIEINRLREHMSPLDTARLAWPDSIPVPLAKVPKAVVDRYLHGLTMADLRQGVFIRRTPEELDPVFIMSWETSERTKKEEVQQQPAPRQK